MSENETGPMEKILPEASGQIRRYRHTIMQTFITVLSAFIVVMTLLLNIIPTISSRDAVFSSKRVSLMNQSAVLSSSLSLVDVLSYENIAQVVQLINIDSLDSIRVVDSDGKILYGTQGESGDDSGNEETLKALSGKATFSSRYTGSSFLSYAATPIVANGNITGAVLVEETDTNQAETISNVQRRLLLFSAVTAAFAIFAIVVSTSALTSRITEIVRALRAVSNGLLSKRIAPKGRDEVTELAEEFNSMAEMLENTEESRRRFVSDASHELRTPLAAIRLLSDSIVQTENMDEETMRDFVNDIGNEAERLQRLTEKLLLLTRMDSGIYAQDERSDMKDAVMKTLHLLSVLAEKNGISLETSLEDNCYVFCSEDDLYQIIFNIAENAIKYNVDGGKVSIRLSHDNDLVRLVVEDTGIGIPEDDVSHIFERFYRVDKARSRSTGGSGLGLSIVYNTVTNHGGEIFVERGRECGTVFTVLFPLDTDLDAAARLAEDGLDS